MSDGKRLRSTGRAVFALTFGAYMFSYFGRGTFASCITGMQSAGVLEEGLDGWISAAFLLCYAAGQFINGRLVTRFHPKFFMSAGLALSGICNLSMTLAASWLPMLFLWALNGYACSMLWPTVIRVFSEWLDDAERPGAGTAISVSIPLGSIVCYLICSAMLRSGWRLAFAVSGLLLILGASVWFFAVGAMKTRISEKAAVASVPDLSGERKKLKLGPREFFSYGLGVIAVCALFNGALKEAVVSWTPKFLEQSYDFSPSDASLISMVIPAVSVSGPYLGRWLNDRFFRNESMTSAVLFGISCLCCLGQCFVLKAGLPVPAVILLAVSTACMWGVNNQIMAFVPFRFSRTGLSPAVSGTLNAVIFAGSSCFTVLYGRLADVSGSWLPTAAVWTCAGLCAAAAGAAWSGSWKRRMPGTEPDVPDRK